MTTPKERQLRADFFQFVFGKHEGFICIATESAVKGDFRHRFFQWPTEESKLLNHVEESTRTNKNVWFGVNLLSKRERKKRDSEGTISFLNFKDSNILWADLDECDPDGVEPRPQLVIESSPKRFQAIWRIDQDLDPQIAEDYSKRLAYSYAENGADRTGWDLGQLLRVPYTNNLKYPPQNPRVKIRRQLHELLPTELFDVLSEQRGEEQQGPLDDPLPEVEDAEVIIAQHQAQLRKTDFSVVWDYQPAKGDDWSKLLWRLLLCCFEAGLTKAEVYSIAYASTVNKYKRDKRPDRYLWRDVQKAFLAATNFEIVGSSVRFEMPELIPGDEYNFKADSFIDSYIELGKEATDACVQYHELSAFILLSSLLAGSIKLSTSFGVIKPNLWGLILGESSLTRKTTAMNMARDIIDFVDRDILFATDGSSEGILTGLSGRPGRTSMFYRDEVVGLFKEIAGKQYLSGIPQMFTQLYDGGFISRRLRKELVTVTDPIFIFFGGGIRDQFLVAADEDFVYSGFLPRFLIVSGEADLGSLRRIGPPTEGIVEKRQNIYQMSHKLYQTYAVVSEVEILGQSVQMPTTVEASLSLDAWNLNGEIGERLTLAAHESPNKGLADPTFQRLADSMLKMAVLVAAARQVPDNGQIQVEEGDVRRAAYYIQQWGPYTIDVILNLGQNTNMRTLVRVRGYIERNPGVARSKVMQAMNIANKRQMNEIEETLEARGEIRVDASGRGRTYTGI